MGEVLAILGGAAPRAFYYAGLWFTLRRLPDQAHLALDYQVLGVGFCMLFDWRISIQPLARRVILQCSKLTVAFEHSG